MLLIAYLSFAERDLAFSLISFNSGFKGFLENDLNKHNLSLLIGKYLEGLLFKLEYRLKKFLTILSSKE